MAEQSLADALAELAFSQPVDVAPFTAKLDPQRRIIRIEEVAAFEDLWLPFELGLFDPRPQLHDGSRAYRCRTKAIGARDRLLSSSAAKLFEGAAREELTIRGRVGKAEAPETVLHPGVAAGLQLHSPEATRSGTLLMADGRTPVFGVRVGLVSDELSVSTQKKPSGRPAKYDWKSCRTYIRGLLDHHGLPSEDDPEWRNQAAVEREILKFFSPFEPGETRVREYARVWIEEYRSES